MYLHKPTHTKPTSRYSACWTPPGGQAIYRHGRVRQYLSWLSDQPAAACNSQAVKVVFQMHIKLINAYTHWIYAPTRSLRILCRLLDFYYFFVISERSTRNGFLSAAAAAATRIQSCVFGRPCNNVFKTNRPRARTSIKSQQQTAPLKRVIVFTMRTDPYKHTEKHLRITSPGANAGRAFTREMIARLIARVQYVLPCN